MEETPQKALLLRALIEQRSVRVMFQPIVDLNDGMVCAYEALCRPMENMGFANADHLFDTADRAGMQWDLEQVTRSMAIEAGANWPRDVRLFLNSSPQVFSDPRFADVLRNDLSRVPGLTSDRIVLEITERSDTEFTDSLLNQVQLAKDAGFHVAVDDAGAGTSGLNRMMAIRPQWIKLDRQLVSGIDTDSFKQNLVRFFVHFARMSGVSVIAEGIEQAEELGTLIGLGVRYGQGYFLARPGERATTMDAGVISDIRERWAGVEAAMPSEPRDLPMIRLCRPVLMVDGTRETIADLAATLASNAAQAGIVVMEGRRLIGWADRELVINSSFGPLANEPIIRITRATVCALTPDSTVHDALRLVCTREDHDLSQPLIVASGAEVVGVVPMRELLRAAASEARPSSGIRAPLTGLPARVRADQHLEEMIARSQDVAMQASPKFHADAVFIDIRKFSDYNSVFGYEMGDRLIRALGDQINAHVVRGATDVFLAHLGDDRFLLTARAGVLEDRLRRLIDAFDALGPTLTDASVMDHLVSPLQKQAAGAAGAGLRMGLRVLFTPSVFLRADHPREVYRVEQQLRQKARNQEATMAAGESLMIVDRRTGNSWADRLSA